MSERHAVPSAQVPHAAAPSPIATSGLTSAPVTVPKAEANRADFYTYLPRVLMVTNAILLVLLAFQLFHRPKYEYRTVSPSDYAFEDSMNAYGAQGWKTETCRRATTDSVLLPSANYECILSRPRLGW